MKKLVLTLCMAALATGAFAQGTVNFLNGTATYVSADTDGSGPLAPVLAGGAARSWYYALLIAPAGTTDPLAFSFSGNYATNLATAGTVFGGNGRQVTGWLPGTTRSFLIAGWSADLGPTWNQEWLNPAYSGPTGLFGYSAIRTGVAGGVDTGGNSIPTLNLFGGTQGVQTGWVLTPIGVVPEPSSFALAGLGAAVLMIFRRRK